MVAALQYLACDLRHPTRRGGHAVLIRDHAQAVALLRQAQHGFQKIAAMRTHHPRTAEDEKSPRMGHHLHIAISLAAPIDRQRVGGIAFFVGVWRLAIEHIVGGVMHHGSPQGLGLGGHDARSRGVDGVCQGRLMFSFVDGCVGRCIDDVARRMVANHRLQSLCI